MSFEFVLGGLVLFGIFRLVLDLHTLGYLPEPFFHDKTDTFMDWYNPAYWSHNYGAYDEWYSIYPPISFLFVRLLSRPSCYTFGADQGRACDPQGYVILSALMLVNLVLVWLSYRKVDKVTAAPRAIAASLGMSMLFGWDRGNLIIPSFSLFVLGYGPLLRQGWLKSLCAALTINFKPYLVLAALGWLLRRDWRWLEMTALWSVVIYSACYALLGDGDPLQLIANIRGFASGVTATGYGTFEFTTTYNDWLSVLNSPFPIMHFVGSRIMEGMESVIPVAIGVALGGVGLSLVGAALQPGAVSRRRLGALVLLALQAVSHSEGGYGLVFAIFLVFFERFQGFGRIFALTAAYVWCFPLDLDVSGLTYSTTYSFLSNRFVDANMPITLGQIVRPSLVLFMQYGLVIASMGDLLRHARRLGPRPVRSPGPAPGGAALAAGEG